MMQIEDPRWRSYAGTQRALMGRYGQNHDTIGLDRALDALLYERPREGETFDAMVVRVRSSAMRRERHRRNLTIAADARALDDARVRSNGEPDAAIHARIMLATIVLHASPGERRLVVDLATGGSSDGVPAATFRKRLQRFRSRLCT